MPDGMGFLSATCARNWFDVGQRNISKWLTSRRHRALPKARDRSSISHRPPAPRPPSGNTIILPAYFERGQNKIGLFVMPSTERADTGPYSEPSWLRARKLCRNSGARRSPNLNVAVMTFAARPQRKSEKYLGGVRRSRNPTQTQNHKNDRPRFDGEKRG